MKINNLDDLISLLSDSKKITLAEYNQLPDNKRIKVETYNGICFFGLKCQI